jgi:hypothetical protein
LGVGGSQVAVTGDLTLAGTLNLGATSGFGPGTYPLFTYGGALSVATLTIGTAPVGYTYSVDTSVAGQVNSGSGGPTNGTYYLLSSTNLTSPLTGWTRLSTNQFDANGNFNITNSLNKNFRQDFFRLQIQ